MEQKITLNQEELSMIALALRELQASTPKEDSLSRLEIAQLQIKISDTLLLRQA